MIELTGLKKVRERIKELKNRDSTEEYHTGSISELEQVERQFQSDFRAVRQDVDHAHAEFWFCSINGSRPLC